MLDQALIMAAEAVKVATQMGLRVVISVVDAHGNPVLLHRMDGAPLHALDMAFRKAYTAISFGAETASLMAKVQPGQPLYGLAVNSGGKLIAFGGGAPVALREGVSVGVGISGGTTSEDVEILASAVEMVTSGMGGEVDPHRGAELPQEIGTSLP
jgi:uncharacterized protein GlcG (DUF336 family)